MSNWKEYRLGDLGTTYTGLSGKKKDDFGRGANYIPYLNILENSRINPQFLDQVQVRRGENQNAVKRGDIFFTTSSETVEDVGMTSVLLEDLPDTYLNSFCFGFRPNDLETVLPEFFAHYLRSDKLRREISFLGQGSTRYNISKTQLLKRLVVQAPGVDEQRRIALILDTADTAIAKTEALIAKLKLIMTGLLRDLITLGVDNNGELRRLKWDPKGSRQERPEKLPTGWEVKTLNDVGDWHAGGTPRKQTKSFWGGTIPWLTPKDMKVFRVKRTTDYVTELGASCGTRMVPPDSIFIVVRGMILAHTFPVCISSESFTFNQDIRALTANGKASMPYLAFWFLANQQRMLGITSEATHGTKRIDMAELRKVEIALPSLVEQNEIVRRLKEHENRIDREVLFLNKMQVFKSGLMNDLLSGRKPILNNQVAIR